jgi:hypothetical protein
MTPEMTNFIDVMYEAYRENAEMRHYAEYPDGESRSTMPTTSFVYNFFIYNSIYQCDWEASWMKGKLTPWNAEPDADKSLKAGQSVESVSEPAKQKGLEKFLRKKCSKRPPLLGMAFSPLGGLTDLEGSWTIAPSDRRLPASAGTRFFHYLAELSTVLSNPVQVREGIVEASKANFESIQKCRFSIYLARNSVFHGYKSPGDPRDRDQKKRLAHYDLFMKCLLGLFFLCHERPLLPAASFRLGVEDSPGTKQ